VHGLVEGVAPTYDDDAIATFRPTAVAVYREAVAGSPRNSFAVTITSVEPLGDLVRVRAGALAADVTVQAAAELDLVEGQRVVLSVKATEVSVYSR
jgi:molybdate transport system ATP-binding protein